MMFFRFYKQGSRTPGLVLALACIALTFLACGPRTNAPVTAPPASTPRDGVTGSDARPADLSYRLSRHLALGNPSGANENDPDNYLIVRKQYALSYNDDAGHANWVSWNLREDDLGVVERGQFAPDFSLPGGFTIVTPRDYTGSGYDRGHLCPSGDRTATVEDNDATFLMTNIIPQAPGNNQGPWKQLEDESREMARTGLNLYIIAGGAGSKRSIARGKIKVPAVMWKIIVVLPGNQQAPEGVSEATRVIAVRIPNNNRVRNRDWRNFRVSPRQIEEETGYRFLTTIPAGIREVLVQRVDTQ
ncbi:MAG: DNA/RNA non-specific endonuclease [Chloroherpetonaceae bacterium]|nr:DNA/RNA non-specific endonuclease [Chthonomonadaceae bacterium]MDW8206508.1 DNA/RNA non-specific endonuclease [Chloroherpetonaceae bacterium]